MTADALTLQPIGVAHTPFVDRVSAPRQPRIADGVEGTIELFAGHGYEHALEDLEGWDRIWVVFWFHLNEGWRPKVLPPRSTGKRRGVFSTRSPHRPNPIGISVLRLEGVEGLVLRVKDVDLVDGTPILDIKPYVPYADAFPDASTGSSRRAAPVAIPKRGPSRGRLAHGSRSTGSQPRMASISSRRSSARSLSARSRTLTAESR
jgi:tRNA-Thr(GGU) m(6)t(6)A37 methyltransferase TsaA